MNEPVPTSNGGIAPSGAESRDRRVGQAAQRLAGIIVTNLPGPVLKVLLRGMRQERPPRKVRRSVTTTVVQPGGVRMTWLAPQRRQSAVVVYLPGGLYVAGPVAQQWNWLAEIQQRSGQHQVTPASVEASGPSPILGWREKRALFPIRCRPRNDVQRCVGGGACIDGALVHGGCRHRSPGARPRNFDSWPR